MKVDRENEKRKVELKKHQFFLKGVLNNADDI